MRKVAMGIPFLVAGVGIMTSICTAEALKLVPMPRTVEIGQGYVTLSDDWTVCVQDLFPEDLVPAEQIVEDAEACFGWSWTLQKGVPDTRYILLKGWPLKGDEPALFREQGYVVRVESDRIVIEAPSAVGRFYGGQTLRQLLRNAAESKRLPLLRIEDYPALAWRGISDDISRGQVSTVADFKNIIRQLAYYKKNLYQPYMEDMFRFDASPNIGADRGAVTRVEMAQIVDEARKYHITITPVFESLGHQDRLLSLPENRKYAEIQDPTKTPWSFAPTSEEAFQFVTTLVDELAAATPSPFFHIGGDESWDVGEGVSKDEVETLGVGKVHADYFTRLVKHIQDRHGRRTMLYGDMLLKYPESLKDLSKDSMIVDWHYSPAKDYPSVKQIKEAGFVNIFVSPGIWGWANFYPNSSQGFANVGAFVEVGKREGVTGSITSSWGDRGAENLRENNWPAFAYSGAAEWETGTPTPEEFLGRFGTVHYGLDSPSLADALKKIGWLDYLDSHYFDGMFHKRLRMKPQTPEWLEKMKTLETNMKSVRETVSKERGRVRFHAEQLDGVDHAARRYLYMARRERILHGIAQALGDKRFGELPAEQQDELLSQLRGLQGELTGIIDEFTRLWLRDNKYPKLDFNLDRLHVQVADLQGLIVEAFDGTLERVPAPVGTWFWYPDKDPRKETTIQTCSFLREFDLTEVPISADLKCWADDRATVYLNGRRLFRTTYPEDPKSATVRPMLQVGKNYLALEAMNTVGAAGILFELVLVFPDRKVVTITGDDQWRTSTEASGDWRVSPPEGDKWKPVMLLGSGPIDPWKGLNW